MEGQRPLAVHWQMDSVKQTSSNNLGTILATFLATSGTTCRDCHLPASSLATRSHGQGEVSDAVGEPNAFPNGWEEDTHLQLSGRSELPTTGLCRSVPAGIPAADVSTHTRLAERHPDYWKDAQEHRGSDRGLKVQRCNLYLRVEWKGTNYTTISCRAEGRSSASPEQGGKSKPSYFAKSP